MGFTTLVATAAPKAKPGDQCAPQIANNAAAAGVCGPVCEGMGLRFAGNWSNDRNHPPVVACAQGNKGQSVCGCGAVPPGDVCAPQIANNAAAASVCSPVCDNVGLRFAGNWSNDRNHPPVKACMSGGKGQSVCGCGTPAGDQCAGMIPDNAGAARVCEPVCKSVGLRFGGNWSNDRNHPPVKACMSDNKGQSVCGCAP